MLAVGGWTHHAQLVALATLARPLPIAFHMLREDIFPIEAMVRGYHEYLDCEEPIQKHYLI